MGRWPTRPEKYSTDDIRQLVHFRGGVSDPVKPASTSSPGKMCAGSGPTQPQPYGLNTEGPTLARTMCFYLMESRLEGRDLKQPFGVVNCLIKIGDTVFPYI